MDNLFKQYNLIYRFFRSTTEPYDYLDWSGEKLLIFLNEKVIEKYSKKELQEIIKDF